MKCLLCKPNLTTNYMNYVADLGECIIVQNVPTQVLRK